MLPYPRKQAGERNSITLTKFVPYLSRAALTTAYFCSTFQICPSAWETWLVLQLVCHLAIPSLSSYRLIHSEYNEWHSAHPFFYSANSRTSP